MHRACSSGSAPRPLGPSAPADTVSKRAADETRIHGAETLQADAWNLVLMNKRHSFTVLAQRELQGFHPEKPGAGSGFCSK
ncbi:hypothetical protein EYF80_066723 [Liparis tanakae]|uniref:Uncharacterized protein n=1 Tax=Liparis tanakae TaxID=230148 RepID=A0A4Z2E364_9TELE|nr:hypothetical protein EYF80_066723 [Liparis tanakae]